MKRGSSSIRGAMARGVGRARRSGLAFASSLAIMLMTASFVAQDPVPVPTGDPGAAAEPAELPDVRITLTAPKAKVFAWGASEWTVTVENRTEEPMPFSPLVLTPEPYGSVAIYFEVKHGAEDPLILKPGPHRTAPRCGMGPPKQFLAPGKSESLQFALHGTMQRDLAARSQGKSHSLRFGPAFSRAGKHVVSPVVFWAGQRIRGVPVVIEVAENTGQTERFRAELRALVDAGYCIDVLDVYAPRGLADLDKVADVIALDKHSIFGTQLRIGLAKGLFELEQSAYFNGQRDRLPIDCRLSRIKELICDPMPEDFGLDRTLTELRKNIADWEQRREGRSR